MRNSFVKEKLLVDIEIKNPLKIPLDLKDISLICEYKEKIDEINLFNMDENTYNFEKEPEEINLLDLQPEKDNKQENY